MPASMVTMKYLLTTLERMFEARDGGIDQNYHTSPARHLFTLHRLCNLPYACQHTCQVSRLRIENFDLTPTHAHGPIFSRPVEKYELLQPELTHFPKLCKLNQGEKRKIHIQWVNDDTFPEISDFLRKDTGNAWTYERLPKSSDICIFVTLRKSSHMIVSSSKILAFSGLGVRKSWQVYNNAAEPLRDFWTRSKNIDARYLY